ncbi:MAG: DUF4924 family protein [Bacteroidota bacterium]
MLIAQKKRKENIAEYILYLYQVEDLIRAFHLDMNLINDKLVAKYQADEKTSEEISDWYENLVMMMEKEGIQKKGHLQFVTNLLGELNEFHVRLMETKADQIYISIYQAVAGLLNELKQKNPQATTDVHVAIDGIYGYLMLKIQQKEITDETEEAVKRLSHWLAHLSKLFRDYEKGDLAF